MDSTEKDFFNTDLTNDPIPGDISTTPQETNSNNQEIENITAKSTSPEDPEAGGTFSQCGSSNLRKSVDPEKIKSIRRLVSKLQLTPKTESSVKRILRLKAKTAKNCNEKQKQLTGSGTNSNVMNAATQSKTNATETNTESGGSLTESMEGNGLNAREDSNLAHATQRKTKNTELEIPTFKSNSSPNIYIEDPDEKDEDDDGDDFYLDDFPEEEKTLKHANTMPLLYVDRGEKEFPARAVEQRETSFHKEIFLLQEYREHRPSTAKRRASITIKNLAKEAETDLKHSWLLDEQTRELWAKFEERKRALTIVISDEDPMSAIEQRLEEVKMMSKPRKDMRHVLERLPKDQKENILKVDKITSKNIRDERRKTWERPCDKIRWAGKMISLLFRVINARKRYYMEKNEEGQLQTRVEKVAEVFSGETAKTNVGADLQTALTTPPDRRDSKTLKKILWLLRASRAFKHLFPAEMEVELAKYVAYEKYDDGRVIATQGHAPERFYYIVAGRVALLRQYKLTTGQVTKHMGFLTKGMTSDPAEIERNWLREDSMVARGQVEVLLLDREVFSYLQHTTQGPPLDFLRSLVLFDEFPVELFLSSTEAIEYGYYGQGKVVVEDSNASPWLYVVKSGQVKVVRYQTVIDARASNQSRFISPRVDDLGMGKSFSHANTMLGVQAKQKKRKQQAGQLNLPQITKSGENLVSNPLGDTVGAKVQTNHNMSTVTEEEEDMYNSPSGGDQLAVPSIDGFPITGSSRRGGRRSKRQKLDKSKLGNDSFLPQIKIPTRDNEDSDPLNMWLTREKTKLEKSPQTGRKEQMERPAYLQLDLLTRGAVFGLKDVSAMYYKKQGVENMYQALSSDGPGVTLLSDGAEVIKINKRFFLHNAGNNTMLKVDTMYKEYLSEDEAKQLLYDRETWMQYKNALWTKMTEKMSQSVLSNR